MPDLFIAFQEDEYSANILRHKPDYDFGALPVPALLVFDSCEAS